MGKILKLSFIFILLSSLNFFTGCTGAEDYTIEKNFLFDDSVNIYWSLEQSRAQYINALHGGFAADYESAARLLSGINTDTLENHREWKRDFSELGVSLVQDYITAVGKLPDNSRILTLAKQLNVKFEKVEKKNYSDGFDPINVPRAGRIPLVRNSYVDNVITYFQNDGRKFMDRWLYRSGRYFNLVRSILSENNAPEELVYLAMIESGLNPQASSRAGAVGLWQFMPGTGSMYGLYYDNYTDDKRDIEKATDAAARHLNDLYSKLGDWYLALASYNAGIGRINAAIEKSGSRDFWTLKDYLPKETQNYVPQFIAAALITMNPQSYGFNNVDYGMPIEYDRVIIKAKLTVSRIAELCEIDAETIRELNPQLLQDSIPVFDGGYLIKIPKNSFDAFTKNYENASDFEKYSSSPSYEGSENGGGSIISESYSYYRLKNYSAGEFGGTIDTGGKKLIVHSLKEGEDYEDLAEKFAVRASDIRIWNQIPYGKNPDAGDSISVWITDNKYKELFSVKEKPEQKQTPLKAKNKRRKK